MAINVNFEGYVNEVKQFSWGTVAKMSHSQRAKNDATGEWETVGRDYFDVTMPEGATATEGDIVRVEGTLKVGTFDKKDGTTGVSLKVRAQNFEQVMRSGTVAAPVSPVAAPAGWEPISTDTPF